MLKSCVDEQEDKSPITANDRIEFMIFMMLRLYVINNIDLTVNLNKFGHIIKVSTY